MTLPLEQTVTQAAEQLACQFQRIENVSHQWQDRDLAYPLVAAAMDDCLSALSTTALPGSANRLPSGWLWEIAGRWLQHGELLHRARMKPRGYAGDDVLLARICESWHGDHPWGQLIDRYFQQHAAPQAVRNRTDMVTQALVQHIQQTNTCEVRIVSIGSGPALDIQRALNHLTVDQLARLQVVLLDLDQQALAAAEGRLTTKLAPHQLRCCRENLFRLPQRSQSLAIAPADFVFSTGFFDYLTDQDAATLLNWCWQTLGPRGRLLAFNFAPQHPSQTLMEWLGNWYLIYRDHAQMHALAKHAGIPADRYQLTAEPLGIDLAIDAWRP